ncbi:tripartite motif containing 16 L homeolog [Xenopus laevis]|uniref:MGC84103 protein n=2 Tax=Xenopus laevis TaxID=8355 RepID=Q6GLZ3_XENLA|nr:tripartite motif containing 16 L homeolog [Xenopus laevis]AAH74300.1 MGC84103 protein [Xenopus laevis]OCT63083.1 hypothetical protein XELAEV_18044178mg [Xenopus laevis]
MADTGAPITSKPVCKSQSASAILPMAPREEEKPGMLTKSNSVAQLGTNISANGSAGDVARSKPPTVDDAPDMVLCDFCLEAKVKALKTCLTCMISYCETHLRPHLEKPKLHAHQLVNPINDAEIRRCSTHNQPLDWFCQEDLMCLCQTCATEQHKEHNPVLCSEARKQKEAEVNETVAEYEWKLKSAEIAIEKLEANTTSIQNSVLEAKRAIDLQFADVHGAVKKSHDKVREFLETRERAALNQSNGIKTHLEQKCSELRKHKVKVERIASHRNEFSFLQEYCEFKKSSRDETLPSVYIGLKDKLSGIQNVISESTEKIIEMLWTSYMDRLQEFAKEEDLGIKTMVSAIVPKEHRISAPKPASRNEFLKYKSNLTLDPVTAHRFLRLLEDNRKVSNTAPWQHPYPDDPQRFEDFRQVLSAESFYLGRHYYEVEFKGEEIYMGLTYKCINRKGSESNSCITGNDFSWTLKWNGKEFSAWHSDVETPLKTEKFSRVGIYVNYVSGNISFYGVTDKMTLLHQFDGKFTEPLYAAFWLPKKESSAVVLSPDNIMLPPASSPTAAGTP